MNRQGKKAIFSGTMMVAATLVFSGGIQASAADFQDIRKLDILVADIVGADVGEVGGARVPIDRRLRLTKCPQEPKVEGPVFGAAIVRCPQLGWRIRVPLRNDNMRSRKVVIAKKPEMLVRRGQNVALTYKGHGFSISRQMVAEQNGALGDAIWVKSGRRKNSRIMATIIGNGKVTVQSQ